MAAQAAATRDDNSELITSSGAFEDIGEEVSAAQSYTEIMIVDDEAFREGDSYMTQIERDGKWGYADSLGREVIPPIYDNLGHFFDELATAEKDGKCGFIDKTGRQVIPLKYEQTEAFSEGLGMVKRDGKWGYVDTTGREVIAPKYDYVDFFEDGRAEVELDGQAFYIDKSGNRVE